MNYCSLVPLHFLHCSCVFKVFPIFGGKLRMPFWYFLVSRTHAYIIYCFLSFSMCFSVLMCFSCFGMCSTHVMFYHCIVHLPLVASVFSCGGGGAELRRIPLMAFLKSINIIYSTHTWNILTFPLSCHYLFIIRYFLFMFRSSTIYVPFLSLHVPFPLFTSEKTCSKLPSTGCYIKFALCH